MNIDPRIVERIHALGPRALAELVEEIVNCNPGLEDGIRRRLDAVARIDRAILRDIGRPARTIGEVAESVAEATLERMLNRLLMRADKKKLLVDLYCSGKISTETVAFMFYRFGLRDA